MFPFRVRRNVAKKKPTLYPKKSHKIVEKLTKYELAITIYIFSCEIIGQGALRKSLSRRQGAPILAIIITSVLPVNDGQVRSV